MTEGASPSARFPGARCSWWRGPGRVRTAPARPSWPRRSSCEPGSGSGAVPCIGRPAPARHGLTSARVCTKIASRNEASGVSQRIAVIGGGIGGLAAAGFLHRAGRDVTVYEQAAMLTEVGAGVVVSPNAARLLRRLGLMERFRDLAVPLEVGWEFRRWQDGRVLFSQRLGADCERLYGEHTYTAHRADLLELLAAAVPQPGQRLG